MTIVASTKAVMRRRHEDGTVEVRLVLGKELLAFTGWGRGDYAKRGETSVPNETLASLAGNAFSAFASGAIMAASLPMLACGGGGPRLAASAAPAAEPSEADSCSASAGEHGASSVDGGTESTDSGSD